MQPDDDVFPDRSMELRDKIAWMVETDGWAIEPVDARADLNPPRPAYTYTIGLATSFSFAEVVICGLTPVASRGLLGLVVDLLREGQIPPVGEEFLGLFDGEQRCALLPVDEQFNWFASAADFHGETPFSVVQLLWPDRNGFLPGEAGFDQRLTRAQPLLGSRS
jgi:hypothetical protein